MGGVRVTEGGEGNSELKLELGPVLSLLPQLIAILLVVAETLHRRSSRPSDHLKVATWSCEQTIRPRNRMVNIGNPGLGLGLGYVGVRDNEERYRCTRRS